MALAIRKIDGASLGYNGSRMHSMLNYLSPARFEQEAHASPLALAA
jgi:hypothetical protein